MPAVNRDLRALVWLVVVVLSCGLSLFLTWRRISGALVQPASSMVLVIAAAGLAVSAALLRRVWPVQPSSVGQDPGATRRAWSAIAGPPSPGIDLSFALPGIAAVLLLASVTLPGTPATGLVFAWLLLTGSETVGWLLHRRTEWAGGERARSLVVESDEAPATDGDEEPAVPAGLMQQLTRVREADHESIHALVRTEIPAGDRLGIVHLAFCPPLAGKPELTAHAIESSVAHGVDVHVMQSESFGARIEMRSPRALLQPQCMLIEVIGSVIVPKSA